jgi:hypothetical protein
MGCDIHPSIARRTGDGKLKPFMYSRLDLGRDYLMFGLLAGVRGGEELFEPRGLPDDVPFTDQFDFDRMEDDAHTPSWLTTAEVMQVVAAYSTSNEQNREERCLNPHLAALAGLMEGVEFWADEYDPGGGAVLIFWFDN